jgi:cobalt/nickel transport system permease protein
MHVPDGVLSPAVCVITGGVAAVGVVWAAVRVSRAARAGERLPAAGAVAACVFAAQMVNFPLGHGVSGHLLGGALAAIVLGPHLAVLAMTTVVLVQCLLFGDGGLTALGANVLNLALIGPLAGSFAYQTLRRRVLRGSQAGVSAAVAAGFSVVLASVACAFEFGLSGNARLTEILPALVGSHLGIGIFEAAVTGAAVFAMSRALDQAPALSPPPSHPQMRWFLVPALVAVLLAPLASEAPDALSAALQAFATLKNAGPLFTAPWTDYSLGSALPAWLSRLGAGALGASLVCVAGLLLETSLRGRRACPASAR